MQRRSSINSMALFPQGAKIISEICSVLLIRLYLALEFQHEQIQTPSR